MQQSVAPIEEISTYKLALAPHRMQRCRNERKRHADLGRNTKKIAGLVAAVIAIALAGHVVVSAPFLAFEAAKKTTGKASTDELNIALPENLKYIAIEQLISLP